jgi:hypothetical protein
VDTDGAGPRCRSCGAWPCKPFEDPAAEVAKEVFSASGNRLELEILCGLQCSVLSWKTLKKGTKWPSGRIIHNNVRNVIALLVRGMREKQKRRDEKTTQRKEEHEGTEALPESEREQ